MDEDRLPPTPANRHSHSVERLRQAVLAGPGETEPQLRQAVARYAGQLWLDGSTEVRIPEELREYLDKVAVAAYKVVDADVEELRRAGYSEDQVFELTVAAAVGCGRAALERGLSASRAT
jgi:alkylhydroperoxidase family enzyme